MQSSYKPIGNYIRKVNQRNSNLEVTKLMGLSMTKEFRETTSNIVGTDLSVYKIVRKGQFACDFMSPIRVNKLPVVLKLDDEPIIVSPAYPVFEVIDPNKLDPQYLMMWFSRSEFDRYVSFKCDSAIRGGYDWEELCNTLIPVPDIEKQKEIVAEYHTVVNRIDLNQRLIQKLEETAQAIYKQWFVDFEFPNEEGKPYKSNGGEMVESEFGEIPKGWEVKAIKTFGNVVTGKTPSSENPEDFGTFMPFVTPGDFGNYRKFAIGADRNLSEVGAKNLKGKILKRGSVIVTCIGSDMGKVVIASSNCITNQQMNSIVPINSFTSDYLYHSLKLISRELKSIALGGSTMPMLSKTDFEKISILSPSNSTLQSFEKVAAPINSRLLNLSKITSSAVKLKNLLLSKIATIDN